MTATGSTVPTDPGDVELLQEWTGAPAHDPPELRGRRVSVLDLLTEAAAGVLARPLRALLTALGTVLGVGALVATMGVSATAGNQIVGRFDELGATEVRVSASDVARRLELAEVLPWDAEERLGRLNGVRAAGTLSALDTGDLRVRSVPVVDLQGQSEFTLPVLAASPGLLPAVHAQLSAGRAFDAGHSARADRVVLLGRTAAGRLRISRLEQRPAVFLDDQLYTVLGIIDEVAREPLLLNAVVLPDGTARAHHRLKAPTEVVVDVRVGAAPLIAGQAPIALHPAQPSLLVAQRPPEPEATRRGVQRDIQNLFLVLSGVSLVIGAVGIVNITLVSVLERVGEIGLRRALGAQRRHVAGQFLLESSVIGGVGGVLGASLGVLVVVAVSLVQGWTPVLHPALPLLAPAVGALVGLAAGAYPAVVAAGLQPATALRGGT